MKILEEQIRRFYPDARAGTEVTESYLEFLSKYYQVDLSKTLFATSLCSDDINVSTDFRRVLNRPFTMGGLGGLPFTGYTGMVAFGHHIPDGGDAFIFYGPHIGISDERELGKMRRPGQANLTNSCGALMLALDRLKGTDPLDAPVDQTLDYQQQILEETIRPHKNRILASSCPAREITEVAYEEIHRRIRLLVALAAREFNCRRAFLLGGVIINTSPGFNDAVDVRNFEIVPVGFGLQENDHTVDAFMDIDVFKKP